MLKTFKLFSVTRGFRIMEDRKCCFLGHPNSSNDYYFCTMTIIQGNQDLYTDNGLKVDWWVKKFRLQDIYDL